MDTLKELHIIGENYSSVWYSSCWYDAVHASRLRKFVYYIDPKQDIAFGAVNAITSINIMLKASPIVQEIVIVSQTRDEWSYPYPYCKEELAVHIPIWCKDNNRSVEVIAGPNQTNRKYTMDSLPNDEP